LFSQPRPAGLSYTSRARGVYLSRPYSFTRSMSYSLFFFFQVPLFSLSGPFPPYLHFLHKNVGHGTPTRRLPPFPPPLMDPVTNSLPPVFALTPCRDFFCPLFPQVPPPRTCPPSVFIEVCVERAFFFFSNGTVFHCLKFWPVRPWPFSHFAPFFAEHGPLSPFFPLPFSFFLDNISRPLSG